jgi:glycosyltransferase involved in cell wall biosynthesis
VRLLQFNGFYGDYLRAFHARQRVGLTYAESVQGLLADRFDATHILAPVYQGDDSCQLVIANDAITQGRWAAEQGLRTRDLEEILLAQIEAHRADVIYDLDPKRFDSAFLRRLPGGVKRKVVWHAAPFGREDYSAFDLRLSNFAHYVAEWRRAGQNAEYFNPAYDPVMAKYGANEDRPIDLCFAGSYTADHRTRNQLLSRFATLADRYRVVFFLLHPPFRPWVNVRFVRRLPSPFSYLPPEIRAVKQPAVFGRALYEAFSRAKIVLNASIGVAGTARGNMRCFEAMGCGACMLGDVGNYPPGFKDGVNFVAYRDADEAVQKAVELLEKPELTRQIGRQGARMIATEFSKEAQWQAFQRCVESLA